MSVAARRFILRACSSGNPCIPLSVEQDVISSAPISMSSRSSSSRSSASTCGALRTSANSVLKPIAEGKGLDGHQTTTYGPSENERNLNDFHQYSETLHTSLGSLSKSSARRRLVLKPHMQQQKRFMGHNVKIVLKENMPNGKGFAGDIVSVKAGYARNYLVPKKIAFYATEENVAKYASSKAVDEKSSEDDVARSSEREASVEKTAAMILRKYLKEKELKIWRKADKSGRCHPGVVTARNVRQKLSKQLKIDLEAHEKIRLSPDAVNYEELLGAAEFAAAEGDNDDVGALDALIKPEDLGRPLEEVETCTTEIKQVGDYVAKIYLDGGYCVPLHVKVMRRVY